MGDSVGYPQEFETEYTLEDYRDYYKWFMAQLGVHDFRWPGEEEPGEELPPGFEAPPGFGAEAPPGMSLPNEAPPGMDDEAPPGL